MARAEFHFDFGSPNAYLVHRAVPNIERRSGARFRYVPILLGGVFKATNNRSPAEAFAGIRNKREFHELETRRFVARHGIGGAGSFLGLPRLESHLPVIAPVLSYPSC